VKDWKSLTEQPCFDYQLMEPTRVYSQSFGERGWITLLVDGDNIDGPTTAFQGCCALATDTQPPTALAILWRATLGH
jgi:hypothetical protein